MTFVRTSVLDDRFWSKVFWTDECWLWTAAVNRDGYGVFNVSGKTIPAHQYLVGGRAPFPLEWDHTCRTRNCVRPDHLEAVTHQENVRRSLGTVRWMSQKTRCKFGHLFDEENTYFVPATGARQCKICRLDRQRGYTARNKDLIKK